MTAPWTAFQRYRLRGRLDRLRGPSDDRELILPLDARVILGRDPTCDIVVEARGVSRRHAELVSSLAGLRVEDLGSKNGTFRNGRQIRSSGVRAGDRLIFGTAEFEVEAVGADDIDLAIDLPEFQPIAIPTSKNLTLNPTASLDGNHVPTTWLRALESFAKSLSTTGDLRAALATLSEVLSLTGIAVLENGSSEKGAGEERPGEKGPGEKGSGGKTVLVTSHGRIDERSEPQDPAGSDRLQDRAWHRMHRLRQTGEHLELRLWGRLADSGSSQTLLRTLLHLIELFRCGTHSSGAALEPSKTRTQADPPRLVFPPSYVVASSAAMTDVYRQMASLADAEIPVLVRGETGVGKEWIARILHASSGRSDGPFVAVNCAAIPADLAEAELFGIEKGVATGVTGRPGKFRAAEGGTLFLDEVGETESALQAKLLRALQEREIQPVGGRPRPIDVRILAATNADLETHIASGAFRRDLFYRLAGYVLDIPPLRACQEDIPPLVESFLRRSSREFGVEVRGVTIKAIRLLSAYPWPGNIRELEHEVRSLVFGCRRGEAIDSARLPPRLTTRQPAAMIESVDLETPEAPNLEGSLDLEARVRHLERELIQHALAEAQGVRSRAAKLLGISRNRLARKIRQFEVEN